MNKETRRCMSVSTGCDELCVCVCVCVCVCDGRQPDGWWEEIWQKRWTVPEGRAEWKSRQYTQLTQYLRWWGTARVYPHRPPPPLHPLHHLSACTFLSLYPLELEGERHRHTLRCRAAEQAAVFDVWELAAHSSQIHVLLCSIHRKLLDLSPVCMSRCLQCLCTLRCDASYLKHEATLAAWHRPVQSCTSATFPSHQPAWLCSVWLIAAGIWISPTTCLPAQRCVLIWWRTHLNPAVLRKNHGWQSDSINSDTETFHVLKLLHSNV